MENELNEILANAMEKNTQNNMEASTQKTTDVVEATNNDTLPKEKCPEWLPKKFFKDGKVNAEALAKSYQNLERKMSEKTMNQDNDMVDSVDSPEDTKLDKEQHLIEDSNDIGLPLENANDLRTIMRDASIEDALKEQGLDAEQMDAVYELAGEHLSPIIERIKDLNTKVMEQELEHHFGGSKNWQIAQKNMADWAQANLPTETVEHLASNVDGVKILHKMMLANSEESLLPTGVTSDTLTEGKLRDMMDDPRYWRTKDPSYIKKVQDGFQKLFPDKMK